MSGVKGHDRLAILEQNWMALTSEGEPASISVGDGELFDALRLNVPTPNSWTTPP